MVASLWRDTLASSWRTGQDAPERRSAQSSVFEALPKTGPSDDWAFRVRTSR
jgi:hypothetical protein